MKLVIKDMSFAWSDGKDLFKAINLVIGAGESILITGDNGSGKTTLMQLLAGLLSPTQGSILWDGSPACKQERNLLQNIIYIRQQAEPGIIGVTARQDLNIWQMALPDVFTTQTIDRLLEINGLHDVQDLPFGTLSSGEQRRVALAPLMALSERIWLLDEPMAGLDSFFRSHYMTLINSKIERKSSVFMTSHNTSQSGLVFDRIWHINDHTIKEINP